MDLSPRDENWEPRVRASFAAQKFMTHLGAKMVHVSPGAVDLEMTMQPELTQQHGFFMPVRRLPLRTVRQAMQL